MPLLIVGWRSQRGMGIGQGTLKLLYAVLICRQLFVFSGLILRHFAVNDVGRHMRDITRGGDPDFGCCSVLFRRRSWSNRLRVMPDSFR